MNKKIVFLAGATGFLGEKIAKELNLNNADKAVITAQVQGIMKQVQV